MLHFKIIPFAILSVLVLFLVTGCEPTTMIEEDDVPQEETIKGVNYLNIGFTQSVIEMENPNDTVSVDAFTNDASHLKHWFAEFDDQLMITRYMPEFDPADTLRVNAQGDTVRTINWALIFEFHLSKRVPFVEVRDELQQYPLIDWVDPPYEIFPGTN